VLFVVTLDLLVGGIGVDGVKVWRDCLDCVLDKNVEVVFFWTGI